MIKTCNTCGKEVEYQSEEELKMYFQNHKTLSGSYFEHRCKKCTSKIRKEKYHSGAYNYTRKDPIPSETYGKVFTTKKPTILYGGFSKACKKVLKNVKILFVRR